MIGGPERRADAYRSLLMRTITILASSILLAMVLPLSAAGQSITAAQGQSPQQQQQDEADCNNIAIQQTGYNPAAPPPPTAQAAPVTGSGGRARGAAAGAAVGAVGGNDVGNAAAKGAVVGGVAQRNRNRKAAANANAANAQNQAAGQTAYANSRRACLQSRGYNVN
jgi:hypothetical protein